MISCRFILKGRWGRSEGGHGVDGEGYIHALLRVGFVEVDVAHDQGEVAVGGVEGTT